MHIMLGSDPVDTMTYEVQVPKDKCLSNFVTSPRFQITHPRCNEATGQLVTVTPKMGHIKDLPDL
jgi:hypothetical protein